MEFHAECGNVVRAVTQAAALALALLCLPASAADDPTAVSVEVGGVLIELPAPAGQVEFTANRERMRQFIEAIVPSVNRHLASFASAADIDRVEKGGPLARWATVHAVRELENLPFLEADFVVVRAQMMTAWQDEIANVEKFVEEQLVKSSERVKEAVNVDLQFAASDIVPVEVVADEADAFSTMMLVRSEVKAQGQVLEAKVIVATTMMRLGNRLVALYYYDHHRSQDDIVAVRTATRDWIAGVRAANLTP